jgi:hypothetical protein
MAGWALLQDLLVGVHREREQITLPLYRRVWWRLGVTGAQARGEATGAAAEAPLAADRAAGRSPRRFRSGKAVST